MIKAFMDESGHSCDPVCNFVGMGGIVAEEESWGDFDKKWKLVLDEFINGEPFHMKDFVRIPGAGLYEGWSEDKRRQFLGRLVSVIMESNCRFVGCVASILDFKELPDACQRSLVDPYYIAFQTVTRGMAILAEEGSLCAPEPAALVYSQQEEFGATEYGRAQQLWLSQQNQAEYGKWLGPYSVCVPERVFGLQAADLFAYELTREFEHCFQKPSKNMRWPMKQFVLKEGMGFMVKFFCFETMMTHLTEPGFLSYLELSKFDKTVNAMLYARSLQ